MHTFVQPSEAYTQYQCLDKKTFHEFLEFIHEFEQKEENADILNFITIGYKKALGQTITFKNYVGLIQIKKNVQIQILPKIAFLKKEKDETKKNNLDYKSRKNYLDDNIDRCKDFISEKRRLIDIHYDMLRRNANDEETVRTSK